MTKERLCPICKLLLPFESYHKSASNAQGIQSHCKLCQKAYLVERRKARPAHYLQLSRNWKHKNRDLVNERSKTYSRKVLYGLEHGGYERMLEEQEHRCAICQTTTPGGKGVFHLDHDHVTKKIRGLLCQSCNYGLGNFKDSPALLQEAIIYLKKHNTKGRKESLS